ncbi:unnamed protein product [Arabidopsis arenosa]|uniref:Pectinesterase n=1 Tax=Arabidopsis arenosa TaxID=38785 RepID=A0A8S2B229_ARAAE|nr:unnamed protein product [Arabidopsis arenosa]
MWNGWNYSSKMKKYVALGVTALIMAMVICVEANDGSSPSRKTEEIHRESKLMITKTAVTIICSSTDYKQDCTTSLATVRSPDPRNLIRSAFDLAIVSIRSGIDRGMIDLKSRADADVHTRNALNTCRELMDDAIDDLRKTRDKFRGFLFTRLSDFVEDLCVWLSGSITYQQTCIDGFEGIDSEAAMMMERVMRKGQRLTSNGLAIAANLDKLLKAFRIPFPFLRSRRDRLGILGSGSSRDQSLGSSQDPPPNDRHLSEEGEFPPWVTRHSRRLLARGPRNNGIRADVVVAKDGSGKCKTIAQALAMVPMKNTKKFVIHIKQGVYKEKVEVTKKMLHVMFVGDGPTKTIITGDIAFLPNQVGTYRTASVAVNGDYFMAKDIGFENTAGAARHQAVALRVSADFAVFFNCHMNGYQDTLYVHTHRQFYRNCRVSGTIDFVFGDAKAVFQNCEFVIRRPMEHQQCIVTAQGRKDRRETTGIVIHNSRITGDASYLPVKAKNRAFLGRPWKEFSRTIIMNTEIDDVIDPEGWLKWNETFALNTLFYTEYRNRGRGSGQGRRVRWRGIKRISDRVAREFAPGNFLRGNTWIPQTRIPYNAN